MKTTLFSAFLIVAGSAWAQTGTPPTCTLATLSGTHSLNLTGRAFTAVTSGASLTKAFYGVGTASFDGNGNVTFNLTIDSNVGGGTQLWTGTYTLPSSCAGTLTITSGDSATFTLIPYNSGKDFTITGSDATYAFSGTGAQQPPGCVAASLSGSYAFTGNGFLLSSGSFPGTAGSLGGLTAMSGLMTFDGVSAITASWDVSVESGSSSVVLPGANPDSLTGSYTISSSSCTGTATLTDSSGATYNVILTITAPTANTFSAAIASAAYISTATGHSTFTNPGVSVELAAGSGLPVPPGSLFSIYGTSLGTGTGSLTSFPMPDTLASASVTVNGEAVPLYYVESTLINAQMPLDVTPGVATLVVTNGTKSNAAAISISATASPGVFADTLDHAAAQNLPSYTLNSSANPAPAGSSVVVYFTGGGPVQGQSSLTSGHATPDALFPVSETSSATIDGMPVTIDYIGLVPTAVGGFYQANVVIPTGLAAGSHALVITIDGTASNSTNINTK